MSRLVYAMDDRAVTVVKCTSLSALDSYRKHVGQRIKRISKSHASKVVSTMYGTSCWRRTSVDGVRRLERM